MFETTNKYKQMMDMEITLTNESETLEWHEIQQESVFLYLSFSMV